MATRRRKNGKRRRRNGPRRKTLKGMWRAIPGWLKVGGGIAGVAALLGAAKKAREE